MNESERKAIYKEAYREAYRATENKAKARRAAKETMIACYPETATLLKISGPRVDKSKVAPDVLEDAAKLIAEMGAAAREVTLTDSATPKKSQPAPAFSGNGNGITANGNGEEGRARARVSVPLLRMLIAARPRPGDVFVLGNLDALTALMECGETSIQSSLLSERNGPIQQAGWRFEGLNAPRNDWRVKCVQSPRSEAEVQKERVEKRIADWAAKQEREREEMAAKHARELAALRNELMGRQ